MPSDYLAPNYAPLPFQALSGSGVKLVDDKGKEIIDCLSGYSALNFGHCHPFLVDVATTQLQKLTLTSRAIDSYELEHFAKELCNFTGYTSCLLMNSGAEAVETAIKLARKWSYEKKGIPNDQAEIIVFSNNFHGRTTTIISFSDSLSSTENFGPFTPGFKIVPYNRLELAEAAISPHTAAILIEPIQGEGGIIIPDDGYLRSLKSLCEQNNLLFICDEIQTGFCRTGKTFAHHYEEITPDIVILGKSLGGGIIPLSAIVGHRDLLNLFTPGTHGSTFGGNPLACRIGRAVIELLEKEDFNQKAIKINHGLVPRLQELIGSVITGVRAKGALIGIDLNPNVTTGKDFCKALLHEGVLAKDTRKQTVRIAPPLIISDEELKTALDAIIKLCESLK